MASFTVFMNMKTGYLRNFGDLLYEKSIFLVNFTAEI